MQISAPHTILLVDDHRLLRQGLSLLIAQEPRLRLVGEAANAGEGLVLAETWQPDVALIDLGLPDMPGADLIRRLAQAAPRTRAIALTASLDLQDVARAMAAGAWAYQVKHGSGEDLLATIMAVLADTRGISAAEVAASHRASPELAPPLTARELEIIGLIAGGCQNAEIATLLAISLLTVRKHRQNLMAKLGLHNAAEIAAFAIQHGLYAVKPGIAGG